MLRIALIALAFTVGTARAGLEERQCRVERVPEVRALCLEHVFQQRAVRMNQLVEDTLSRLQAATVSELIDLGKRYRVAQQTWHEELVDLCLARRPDDVVAFEYCRLSGIARREAQLAESLRRAANDFGAPPEYRIAIPDEIEALVPLPNSFGIETRLPLSLPVNPD